LLEREMTRAEENRLPQIYAEKNADQKNPAEYTPELTRIRQSSRLFACISVHSRLTCLICVFLRKSAATRFFPRAGKMAAYAETHSLE
jgi:hypothetical protein